MEKKLSWSWGLCGGGGHVCDGHPTLLQLQLLLSPELITPKDLVLQTQVFISQVMGGEISLK